MARMVMPQGDASPAFEQFVSVLAANRRLALLPEIAGLYELLRAEAEHVVKATVTSAVALDADAIARLTASLKRRFGREVELSASVDPALIGGAVVDAGDVVIDGSIRTKLARLGAALAN
jgi:F-type H+-transporting ATPase subunit delta